jgi:hypothetical protein
MRKRILAMLKFMNIHEIEQPNKGRIHINKEALQREVEKNAGRIIFDEEGYNRWKEEETTANQIPTVQQVRRNRNGAARKDADLGVSELANKRAMEEARGGAGGGETSNYYGPADRSGAFSRGPDRGGPGAGRAGRGEWDRSRNGGGGRGGGGRRQSPPDTRVRDDRPHGGGGQDDRDRDRDRSDNHYGGGGGGYRGGGGGPAPRERQRSRSRSRDRDPRGSGGPPGRRDNYYEGGGGSRDNYQGGGRSGGGPSGGAGGGGYDRGGDRGSESYRRDGDYRSGDSGPPHSGNQNSNPGKEEPGYREGERRDRDGDAPASSAPMDYAEHGKSNGNGDHKAGEAAQHAAAPQDKQEGGGMDPSSSPAQTARGYDLDTSSAGASGPKRNERRGYDIAK